MTDVNDDHRAARVHQRRRPVRHRPAAVPRPARAHARRLPRRDRARRASRPTDIDGLSTYPGPMGTPPGFSGAGAYDVMDALRLEVRLVRQRARDVGPARLGDQRVPRGRVRAREPRAVLPVGVRGLGPGRQGPLRGDARRRRWRRGRVQGVGVHAVEPRVLRAVGRDLDRDVRAAPLPPVRHHARAARVDRARTRGATPRSTRRRSTASR